MPDLSVTLASRLVSLSPQQTGGVGTEVTHAKNAELSDKCEMARKRQMIKKAKENKNVKSYVVREDDQGYMGKLSTDEILMVIEGQGDTRNKRVVQKANSAGVSKDHTTNTAINGTTKGVSVGVKKREKEKRHSIAEEKSTVSRKQSSDNSGAASPQPKPARVSKENGSGSGSAAASSPLEGPSPSHPDAFLSDNENDPQMGMRSDEVVVLSSEQSSDGDSGAMVGGDEERRPDGDPDDEEQYLSADEGLNSATSDDNWAAQGTLSEAAILKAVDDLAAQSGAVQPTEDSDFIPVTGKNKRKANGNPSSSSTAERLSNSAARSSTASYRNEPSRHRRNSAQLSVDTAVVAAAHTAAHSPSPSEHKSYTTPGRRVLADFIDDGTNAKGQSNKVCHGGGTKGGTIQTGPVDEADGGGRYGAACSSLQTSRTASPDRRSSQPTVSRSANPISSVLPSGQRAASACSQSEVVGRWREAAGAASSSAGGAGSPPVVTRGDQERTPPGVVGEPAIASAAATDVAAHCAQLLAALPSDMTNTAYVSTNGSVASAGARTWADIAKSKSPTSGTASPDLNTPSTSANGERCASVASSLSGSVEASSKECDATACGAVSKGTERASFTAVGGVDDSDSGVGVQGISFFYDPNEPTAVFNSDAPILLDDIPMEDFSPSTPMAIVPQGTTSFNAAEQGIANEATTTAECCDTSAHLSLEKTREDRAEAMGGVLLNLAGGKRMVIPAMRAVRACSGSPPPSELRRYTVIAEHLGELWKTFTEHGPVRYKDLQRNNAAAARAAVAAETASTATN